VVTGHLIASTTQLDGPIRTVAAVEVTTNVDDVTGEVVGHVIEQALLMGADDAWAHPIVMKKSRPAVALTVLCRPNLVDDLRGLLLRETGTLGLRVRPVTKHVTRRHLVEVIVEGYRIDVKVGPYGAKPEHDQVVAAAAALGRPIRAIAAEALLALGDVEAPVRGTD
jgi:uncharacterized protein (DUF111 family)